MSRRAGGRVPVPSNGVDVGAILPSLHQLSIGPSASGAGGSGGSQDGMEDSEDDEVAQVSGEQLEREFGEIYGGFVLLFASPNRDGAPPVIDPKVVNRSNSTLVPSLANPVIDPVMKLRRKLFNFRAIKARGNDDLKELIVGYTSPERVAEYAGTLVAAGIRAPIFAAMMIPTYRPDDGDQIFGPVRDAIKKGQKLWMTTLRIDAAANAPVDQPQDDRDAKFEQFYNRADQMLLFAQASRMVYPPRNNLISGLNDLLLADRAPTKNFILPGLRKVIVAHYSILYNVMGDIAANLKFDQEPASSEKKRVYNFLKEDAWQARVGFNLPEYLAKGKKNPLSWVRSKVNAHTHMVTALYWENLAKLFSAHPVAEDPKASPAADPRVVGGEGLEAGATTELPFDEFYANIEQLTQKFPNRASSPEQMEGFLKEFLPEYFQMFIAIAMRDMQTPEWWYGTSLMNLHCLAMMLDGETRWTTTTAELTNAGINSGWLEGVAQLMADLEKKYTGLRDGREPTAPALPSPRPPRSRPSSAAPSPPPSDDDDSGPDPGRGGGRVAVSRGRGQGPGGRGRGRGGGGSSKAPSAVPDDDASAMSDGAATAPTPDADTTQGTTDVQDASGAVLTMIAEVASTGGKKKVAQTRADRAAEDDAITSMENGLIPPSADQEEVTAASDSLNAAVEGQNVLKEMEEYVRKLREAEEKMEFFRKQAGAKQAELITSRDTAVAVTEKALREAEEEYNNLQQQYKDSMEEDWTRNEQAQKKIKAQKKKLDQALKEVAEEAKRAKGLEEIRQIMLDDEAALLNDMEDLQQQLRNSAAKHQEVQKKANDATQTLEEQETQLGELRKKIKDREVEAQARVDAAKALADGRVQVEKVKQGAAVKKAEIASAEKTKLAELEEETRKAKAAEALAIKEQNTTAEYNKKKLQMEKELEALRIKRGITTDQAAVDDKVEAKTKEAAEATEQKLVQLTLNIGVAQKQHKEAKDDASDRLSHWGISNWKMSCILGGAVPFAEWLHRSTGVLRGKALDLAKFLFAKIQKLLWEIAKLYFHVQSSRALTQLLVSGAIRIPGGRVNTLAILAALGMASPTSVGIAGIRAVLAMFGIETRSTIVPVIHPVGVAFSYVLARMVHSKDPEMYRGLVNLKNLARILRFCKTPSEVGTGALWTMAMPRIARPAKWLLQGYVSGTSIIFALESIAERVPAAVSTFSAEVITGALMQVGVGYFLPTLLTQFEFVRFVDVFFRDPFGAFSLGGKGGFLYNVAVTATVTLGDIMQVIWDTVVAGLKMAGRPFAFIAGLVVDALAAIGVVLSNHWIKILLMSIAVLCYRNRAVIERRAGPGLEKAKRSCKAVYQGGKTWCEDHEVAEKGQEYISWFVKELARLRKKYGGTPKQYTRDDLKAEMLLMSADATQQEDTGPTAQEDLDELMQPLANNQGGRRADKRKAETKDANKKKVRLVSEEYESDDEYMGEGDVEQGGAGSSMNASLDIDLLTQFIGIAMAASFAAA